MGLGIDEIVSSTINFSRKNYADYFPEEKFPKDVKMVGNTIKSKKMPDYIAKFLEIVPLDVPQVLLVLLLIVLTNTLLDFFIKLPATISTSVIEKL